MGIRKLLALLAFAPACLGVACSGEVAEDGDDASAESALAVEEGPADVPGSNTEVWSATKSWTDRNPATGNSYEADYIAWVAGFQKTPGFRYGTTIKLTTPPGASYERELAAPTLECADTALFARAAFAALHHLPFFVRSGNIYAGHFGFVTKDGAFHPDWGANFKTKYRDYEGTWRPGQPWPSDPSLRNKHAASYKSGDETFVEVTPGTKGGAGAWFDEFFLNKRVGHFLIKLVDLFGSVNLAQEGNMFHVAPEATLPGDALIHRHGKYSPIGHTLFVYQSRTVRPGRMEIEIVSGSMPARQASWEPHYQSRSYFLSSHAGGEEIVQECRPGYDMNYDDRSQCRKELARAPREGEAGCPAGYVLPWDSATECVKYQIFPSENTDLRKMGGGIRRFRNAVKQGGRWLNIVPMSARSYYIPDTDLERVGARVEQFKQLLDLGSPEERKAAALATINSYRDYIKAAPATCSKRTAREDAFRDLYRAYGDMGVYDKEQVDREHRTFEDYVFAELDYDTSKTCCWNSTNTSHYDTVVKWAKAEMDKAATNATCIAPPVFKAVDAGNGNDGFQRVRAFAQANGLPFPDAWTEDEPCKGKDVAEDSLTERAKGNNYCRAQAPVEPVEDPPTE